MWHLRRSGILLKDRLSTTPKSYHKLGSMLDNMPLKSAADMGFAPFSSAVKGKAAINGFMEREGMKYCTKYIRDGNYITKVKHQAGGTVALKESWSRSIFVNSRSLFQPARISGINSEVYLSARLFASKTSQSMDQNKSESRKDISAFEDPFDAPTDIIPEKPVTFTEGASYTAIILVGLGIATAAAYAVVKELIIQPKEYKIFGKALKRIQDDSQIRVRIGSPITGYGSESKNRAARQRIPNRIWNDEDGVEHVEVNFFIRGPHGAGKVYSEMFKDKEDGHWKFVALIVEITSPSRQQLILESYIPA